MELVDILSGHLLDVANPSPRSHGTGLDGRNADTPVGHATGCSKRPSDDFSHIHAKRTKALSQGVLPPPSTLFPFGPSPSPLTRASMRTTRSYAIKSDSTSANTSYLSVASAVFSAPQGHDHDVSQSTVEAKSQEPKQAADLYSNCDALPVDQALYRPSPEGLAPQLAQSEVAVAHSFSLDGFTPHSREERVIEQPISPIDRLLPPSTRYSGEHDLHDTEMMDVGSVPRRPITLADLFRNIWRELPWIHVPSSLNSLVLTAAQPSSHLAWLRHLWPLPGK